MGLVGSQELQRMIENGALAKRGQRCINFMLNLTRRGGGCGVGTSGRSGISVGDSGGGDLAGQTRDRDRAVVARHCAVKSIFFVVVWASYSRGGIMGGYKYVFGMNTVI